MYNNLKNTWTSRIIRVHYQQLINTTCHIEPRTTEVEILPEILIRRWLNNDLRVCHTTNSRRTYITRNRPVHRTNTHRNFGDTSRVIKILNRDKIQASRQSSPASSVIADCTQIRIPEKLIQRIQIARNHNFDATVRYTAILTNHSHRINHRQTAVANIFECESRIYTTAIRIRHNHAVSTNNQITAARNIRRNIAPSVSIRSSSAANSQVYRAIDIAINVLRKRVHRKRLRLNHRKTLLRNHTPNRILHQQTVRTNTQRTVRHYPTLRRSHRKRSRLGKALRNRIFIFVQTICCASTSQRQRIVANKRSR